MCKPLLYAWVVVAFTAARVDAQDPAVFRSSCIATLVPDAPHTPKGFRRATTALRDTSKFQLSQLIAQLHAEFDAASGAVTSAQKDILSRRIDSLGNVAGTHAPPDFDPLGDADRPNAAGSYLLFVGTPDSIRVTNQMSEDARKAVCFTALEALDIVSDYRLLSRTRLATLLNDRVERWNSFHRDGFSMSPIELLANSWIRPSSTNLEPPSNQLILLHPSISLEASLPFSKDKAGTDALVLEGLGFVHYFKDFTNYWGVSIGTVAARERSVGIGGMIHVGSIGQLGYVYRKRDPTTNKRRDGIMISADLLKMVSTLPGSWREAEGTAKQLFIECVTSQKCHQ